MASGVDRHTILSVTNEGGGDHRPNAARETPSALDRLLHPARLGKALLWVGLIVVYLAQNRFGPDLREVLRGEKTWTDSPILKGVAIAVGLFLIWVVTKMIRDVVVRHRREKDVGGPESRPTRPA